MGLFAKPYAPSLEDITAKAVVIRQGLITSGVKPEEISDKEIMDLARRALIKDHDLKVAKEKADRHKFEQEEKERARRDRQARRQTVKPSKLKKIVPDDSQAIAELISRHTEIKPDGRGYFYFEGAENILFDRTQIVKEIANRYGETIPTVATAGGNGHAKKSKGKSKKHGGILSKASKKKAKPKPFIVTDSTKETLNLHATKIMPKDDRLYFNDPKAVELPIKIVPRLKVIVEAMSTNVKKPMRPYIVYAIAAVIGVMAIAILYSAVIQPSQDSAHKRALEFLEECTRLNQTDCTTATLPSGGGGGGLFDFKPINPLSMPDFTKPRS
jgi:hypothetical protein